MMLPHITSINARINPRPQGSQEELIAMVILQKIQRYSSITHLMWESTPQYDTQKGQNISIAGSAYCKEAVTNGKCVVLKIWMVQDLPHMCFHEKIWGCSQQYKRLWTEVNYGIHLDSIKPDDCSIGQGGATFGLSSCFCCYYNVQHTNGKKCASLLY